jgi:hypothetical protein
VRPDLGHVEDIPAEFLGIFGVEDLDFHVPCRIITAGDGVEKILGMPVWVYGREMLSFFVGKGLVSLILQILNS